MAGTKPSISFLGLGAMGFGMATNLVREGYQVTGFDVYEPTLARFREAGGLSASSPAEAVAAKDYCVCMVATAHQAQSVLIEGNHPVIGALPKKATLLLCSTVPSSYVQQLERELSDKGRSDICLVDCPVSGGAGRAADGTLSIMAGASDAAIDKALPLLKAMSDPAKLYIVKGGIGAGSNMKMCHQVLAASQILAASESMGFASHLGLDLAKVGEQVKKSEGWSWMFEHRLPRMLDANFQPIASAVTIILKDTSIITSEARRVGFATPMTSVAEQQYFTAIGRGFGADDDASLIRLYTDGKARIGAVNGSIQNDAKKFSLVIDLLKGVHYCSAAECLAFAKHLGLDLDQVFDLCTNAAGGSGMLSMVGPEMIEALRSDTSNAEHGEKSGRHQLQAVLQGLEEAVSEAQLLKAPAFLGNQALNLLRLSKLAGIGKEAQPNASSVIHLWGR